MLLLSKRSHFHLMSWILKPSASLKIVNLHINICKMLKTFTLSAECSLRNDLRSPLFSLTLLFYLTLQNELRSLLFSLTLLFPLSLQEELRLLQRESERIPKQDELDAKKREIDAQVDQCKKENAQRIQELKNLRVSWNRCEGPSCGPVVIKRFCALTPNYSMRFSVDPVA